EMERHIMEAGREACTSANIGPLHEKLIQLLGRLKFRTSYSQNVLQHSLEVAHLCGLMADELGLNGTLARRCGLLHDVGKAVEHAYAIQAGRELRVIANATELTDSAAIKLSRDIADSIEQQLNYPGEIKVTVVRETRAVEFAK